MAPRPYWRGYLRLSLVTCPVLLYRPAQAEKTHCQDQQAHRQPAAAADDRRETGKAVDKDDWGRSWS